MIPFIFSRRGLHSRFFQHILDLADAVALQKVTEDLTDGIRLLRDDREFCVAPLFGVTKEGRMVEHGLSTLEAILQANADILADRFRLLLCQ